MAYDTQHTRESIQTAESKRVLFVFFFTTWAFEVRIEKEATEHASDIGGEDGHQKNWD